jgi:hypothetical protein
VITVKKGDGFWFSSIIIRYIHPVYISMVNKNRKESLTLKSKWEHSGVVNVLGVIFRVLLMYT